MCDKMPLFSSGDSQDEEEEAKPLTVSDACPHTCTCIINITGTFSLIYSLVISIFRIFF